MQRRACAVRRTKKAIVNHIVVGYHDCDSSYPVCGIVSASNIAVTGAAYHCHHLDIRATDRWFRFLLINAKRLSYTLPSPGALVL